MGRPAPVGRRAPADRRGRAGRRARRDDGHGRNTGTGGDRHGWRRHGGTGRLATGSGGSATGGSTGHRRRRHDRGCVRIGRDQSCSRTASSTPARPAGRRASGRRRARSPSDAAGEPAVGLARSGPWRPAIRRSPSRWRPRSASRRSAARSYGLAVEVMIPSTTTSAGALGLWFFASDDCSGAIAGASMTPSSATNGWQMVTSSAQAPAGAHSMAVRLELFKPIGQSAAEALFDAVSGDAAMSRRADRSDRQSVASPGSAAAFVALALAGAADARVRADRSRSRRASFPSPTRGCTTITSSRRRRRPAPRRSRRRRSRPAPRSSPRRAATLALRRTSS